MSLTETITEHSATKTHHRNRHKTDSQSNSKNLIFTLRLLCLFVIYVAYLKADVIQHAINVTWEFLRHQWWYRTVYNETVFVQVWAYIPMFAFRLIHNFKLGEKYKVTESSAGYQRTSVAMQLWEGLQYSWPLVILDTLHVKGYAGVPQDVLAEKRTHWFQVTRALPEAPPLLSDVLRHLLVALVVYDALFFLQHFVFHKSATLYRLFHKTHHTHESLNVKVTNQLHLVERMALVLAANAGFKMQGAHPLTRTLFIMTFIPVLMDNHSGYDFPWGYDKVLPLGLVGGPRRHHRHHECGNRYYQPIFTYLDCMVDWWRARSQKHQRQ